MRLNSAQAKSRAWCKECETWHPRDEHVVSSELDRPDRHSYLSAEPRERPTPPGRTAARRSGWLDFSIFLFVVLPVGVIAWSAATYVILWLLPHISAAMH